MPQHSPGCASGASSSVVPRQGETRYLLAGAYYRMALTEWGDPQAPALVCVHGLTRTGRDFDALARALSRRFHVICPDLPGRGGSDWLPDASLYEPASYVQALSHLLAQLGGPVMWLGTSLGGICGMMVASSVGNPITRLVLNDVGPTIPAAALRRIRDYMRVQQQFETLWALEQHLRHIHAPFGPLGDAQWAHLAETSARSLPNGRWALHYDPGIATPIRKQVPFTVELWPWWDKIRVPVLAIRGAESDLLLEATLRRMERSGAETMVVPRAGHAPALMDAESIERVMEFLSAPEGVPGRRAA